MLNLPLFLAKQLSEHAPHPRCGVLTEFALKAAEIFYDCIISGFSVIGNLRAKGGKLGRAEISHKNAV